MTEIDSDSKKAALKALGKATIVKNSIKLAIIFIGSCFLFIYFILLFTGKIGSDSTGSMPEKSANQEELRLAGETLDSLLASSKTGYVMEFKAGDDLLTVSVNNDKWKKASIKEKKAYIKDLADARTTLGLMPDVMIVEHDKNIELASFINGRLSFVELEY